MPFNWLQAHQSDFQKIICNVGASWLKVTKWISQNSHHSSSPFPYSAIYSGTWKSFVDQDRQWSRWSKGGDGKQVTSWESNHLLSEADRSPDNLWAAPIVSFCSQYCSFYFRALFYGMEYSFGQFRTSVTPVLPPSLLPTPSLFAGGWGRDDGRQSGSRGKCTAKAWVLYQGCFSHTSKTQCQVSCYEECSLQPDHVRVLMTYYDQES